MTTTSSLFHIGGPEVMLRISGHSISAERGQARTEGGPWLADSAAGVNRGALAVALDDVTGYIVDAGSPAGRWPVSLGIRVDFVADPPLDGSPLRVTGELVARDERGAMTTGAVFDPSGRTIATMIQRSHLVEAPTTPGAHATHEVLDAPDGPVRDQLGLVETGPNELTMAPTVLSANGMGSVHGGILVCASELAATSAVGATGDLRTTSVDITYVRPCDAADTTTFTSEICHRGRSLSVVRVVSANSSGKASSIATVVLQHI
ncbi:PaaI family thioesterase [Gordonia sp. zg691]|uniref:PaaI family thioesterase n=1 Tax=Gordonia jinghuaiqii TaxID=2758710 RepID=A0A7D7QZG7_9ACTN|nr:hotdog domain-containing protein [Gordonia jinghuaiqii]MBD0863610.1 PaaI family thioesterase [Gordonia jinghuaiqii]MCR5979346.1 PaaI family thioesterase [Gordonia jinghuaiqii]QMT01131.1 PaaI family thioesterase [Gordonia jinghuaiqii]